MQGAGGLAVGPGSGHAVLARPHRRVLGKALDVAVAVVATTEIVFPLGWMVGFAYLALSDGWRTRSFGARIARVRVVAAGTDLPPTWKRSFLRNLPWVTLLTVWQVPIWGSWLMAFGAAGLAGAEAWLYFALRCRDGLGNRMSVTEVVSYSA